MIVKNFIDSIKAKTDYKNHTKKFKEYIDKRERTPNEITYYLVYDIEDNRFKTPSEYDVTYNQIVLQVATIPSKKEDKKEIIIYDYEYKK